MKYIKENLAIILTLLLSLAALGFVLWASVPANLDQIIKITNTPVLINTPAKGTSIPVTLTAVFTLTPPNDGSPYPNARGWVGKEN